MNTLLAHCTEPHSGLVAALAALPLLMVARGKIARLRRVCGFALAMLLLRVGQRLEFWGTSLTLRRNGAMPKDVYMAAMLCNQKLERAAMRAAWRTKDGGA